MHTYTNFQRNRIQAAAEFYSTISSLAIVRHLGCYPEDGDSEATEVNRGQISHFSPLPVKFRGEMKEMCE